MKSIVIPETISKEIDVITFKLIENKNDVDEIIEFVWSFQMLTFPVLLKKILILFNVIYLIFGHFDVICLNFVVGCSNWLEFSHFTFIFDSPYIEVEAGMIWWIFDGYPIDPCKQNNA